MPRDDEKAVEPMTMREAFEKWLSQQIWGDFNSGMEEPLWQAWQASREALVIELPQPWIPDDSEKGDLSEYDLGVLDGIKEGREADLVVLQAAGIRTK